jgi:hypothetical protein
MRRMRNFQVCLLILSHFFHILNEVFTDFIDDDEERCPVAYQGEKQPQNLSYLMWRDLKNDDPREDAFKTLLQGIYRQVHTYSGGHQYGLSFSTGAGDSNNFHDSHNFSRRPSNEEYPLWKISCQVSNFGNFKKR